jgi:ABC-type multidrug transport system fused ATPase/permease subunit
VLCVHVVGNVCAFLRCAVVGVVSERVVTRLRCRLYANLLRQEISFFDANNSGDLASHLAMDTGLIQEALSIALPEIVVGGVKLVATSVAMLWISPRLAFVTVGCVGFSIVVSLIFGKWMGEWSRIYSSIYGKAQAHCYEALGAMRMVQSFVAEDKEEARFNALMGEPNTWWPNLRSDGSHTTTYSLGIAKSFVNSSFFTFIFFSGFGSVYMSMW